MAARGGTAGVGGEWDLLFGDEPTAQAKAQAIAQALKGQQADAYALQALTGGPRAAPQIAQSMGQAAQTEQAGLGQAAQARMQNDIQRQHLQMQGEQLRNALAQHAAALAETQNQHAETVRHNQATEGLNARALGVGGGGGAGGGLFSPEALDQAAEVYHRTGALPPIVRGKAGGVMAGQIASRAAELHPDADLASNRSAYKADTASQTKQQGILDNTESWERTGKANLGVLLDVSKKLADTGSPWANKPVRAFLEGATGDPNMTAFKTAHATVVNEYAKILSGSQGSAGTTKGAHDEAASMIPLESTPAQLAAAAAILDKDAGNRVSSIRSQLSAIRGRTAGKAPAVEAAAPDPNAEARAWATANPSDPRAAAILQRIGAK